MSDPRWHASLCVTVEKARLATARHDAVRDVAGPGQIDLPTFEWLFALALFLGWVHDEEEVTR